MSSRNTNRTYKWPYVVHSLIDRYLTDTEVQDAYDRVTLIAQRPNENENDYADRIAAAARDCANVFEDHALVHYYVRGLLATTRERVTEDLRRLPEKERNDLTAIRRLATAQGNTYRAQVQAAENTKAHTRAKPRTQTLHVAPDPPRNPRRDRNLPHLPGHERMGFHSDLRNDDPELAERIADGLDGSTMRPFNAVFDTGSGMNIVRQDALTDGWQTWLTKDAVLPTLGDANGRPLRLLGEIVLSIRFGNTTYRVPFIVADKLAVIVGTRFMNRYVDAIECRNQTIRLNRGGTIVILSRHDSRRSHERPNDRQLNNDDQNDSPRNDKRTNDDPFNKPHTIRTARTVTIPPMSQVAIPVVTEASGLVYIEPKLPVQNEVSRTNGERNTRSTAQREIRIGPSELFENPTTATEGYDDRLRKTEPARDTHGPRRSQHEARRGPKPPVYEDDDERLHE